MSIQYEKMAQAGFTPSQRALEADEYIKSRNRFDNPDEFQYVGSSVGGPDGYMYIGPARFYTSGTEYAGWLNSGLEGERYADGNAVAQMIDDNPAVPKGPFGPITTYNAQTSSDTSGMLTPDRTTQIPSFCPSGFEYPDGTCVPMDKVHAATSSNNTTSGSTATPPPPAGPTRASEADVNALYQKYLGRDAEQAGLDYWRSEGQYADRGIPSLEDIEYNISISPEAQAYAASQQDSTSTQTRASIEDITRLYQKYLGRNPLQKGLDYWRSTGEYADRGVASLEDIAYNISISPEAQEYAASQEQTGTGAFTGGVNVGGGSFTPGTPQGLSYTPMQLPSVAPAPSVQNVDYVKMIRGALTNSLFKDLV